MNDAIFTNALGVIGRVFGAVEGSDYFPMTVEPNRAPAPDAARVIMFGVTVIYSEGAQRSTLSDNGLGRQGVQVQGTFAARYILATINAGALPYVPVKNDELLRRADQTRFRVIEVMPDGLGGYALRLNEA
jgi:hypothetical protein